MSNTTLIKVDQFVESRPDLKENILPLNDFEREYIIKILNMIFWRVGGKKGAAKILGLHPETLRSRMRKLGIQKPNT